MADLTSIFNLGLAHIGEMVTVADPQELSPQATACRRVYDQARDAVLAEHDWLFARRTVTASSYSPAPHPWLYSYTFPADAIEVRRVFVGTLLESQRPFERGGVTAADGTDIDLILSNEPLAFIRYTRRVSDPTRFPAAFVDALAWRLAFDLCLPLNRSRELRGEVWKVYQQMLAKAEVADARQRYELPNYGPIVDARLEGEWGDIVNPVARA